MSIKLGRELSMTIEKN